MTEMRECWANVYPSERGARGGHYMGKKATCRSDANAYATGNYDPTPKDLRLFGVGYRLHIRLKPPGAPKRYVNAEHRAAWEATVLTHGFDGNQRAWEIYYKTREHLA